MPNPYDPNRWWDSVPSSDQNSMWQWYQRLNQLGIPMVGDMGQQYQWAIDPKTGEVRPMEYNPQGGMGGPGGGGMYGGYGRNPWDAYKGPQYTDWGGTPSAPAWQMPGAYQSSGAVMPNQFQGGNYQVGNQWGQGQYGFSDPTLQAGFQGQAPDSRLDPSRAIAATVPLLQEQRDKGFADAAARAGQSGFSMSTPYMQALGGVERQSLQDLDKITQQYQYDAAKYAADQSMAAQQNALNRSLQGYGIHSGQAHEGQLADLGREFDAWRNYQNLAMQGQLANQAQNFGAWQQQGNWQNDANAAAQDAWRFGQGQDFSAWQQGNQYANQDYWNQVNQWGLPVEMMQMIAAGFGSGGRDMSQQSPWGMAYSPERSYVNPSAGSSQAGPWWSNLAGGWQRGDQFGA